MQKKLNSFQKEAVFLLIKIFLFIAAGEILLRGVFCICQNKGNDMFPMVKDGDLVIGFRLQKEYYVNDLVVIKVCGKKQIRRIKAMDGDEVFLDEEGMTINGYEQQEETIYKDTYAYQNEITYPVRLKKDEVFVLGDNRDESEDSRVYGPIKSDDIIGSVVAIVRQRDF